jgi:GNAT superfamily N-acetyltransferase
MADLSVRLARPDERATLEDLQRRASLALGDYREALLAHPDAIDLPAGQIAEGRVLVAEAEGRPLAFAVVLPAPGGEAELDGLFVEPQAWRGGIGRRLVAEAADRARTLGARSLEVVANPGAERFYLKCGFVLEATAETRFGPALKMRLSL